MANSSTGGRLYDGVPPLLVKERLDPVGGRPVRYCLCPFADSSRMLLKAGVRFRPKRYRFKRSLATVVPARAGGDDGQGRWWSRLPPLQPSPPTDAPDTDEPDDDDDDGVEDDDGGGRERGRSAGSSWYGGWARSVLSSESEDELLSGSMRLSIVKDRFGLAGTVVVVVAVAVGPAGRVGTVTGDSAPVCGVPARSSGGDRGGEIGA
uniref:Uncharacterized protein n=1 Tax=Anopheles merus TaxID=30066 RepID=A0A182V2G5_ANOME